MFVSAHKLAVYHWHKGELGSSYLFDANPDGQSYFERYLRETPNVPVYMLVDVFEEEFKRDTAPHVYGGDRAAIIERKKARLFRDTPYYQAKVQGRETDGRKDDQLLFSAITNPKLINSWVGLLTKHKVPLAGIYSVPLLTESLIKLLPEAGENNLVVSIQSISGLRQTFIQNNQLRVSRLVQLPRYGTEPYAPHIVEEVDKIRRYLNSVRLVSPDSPLNVYFLLAADVYDEVKAAYRDRGGTGMRFLDVNSLLAKSGSSRQVSSPFADQLYVHHLLQTKPANNYAGPVERRFNTMRNIRIALATCGILMLAGSSAWSGYTFLEGLEFRQNTLSARNKTQFYTARYQLAREGLPATPVEPADLKMAVELFESLDRYKAEPLEMVRLVSAGMNRFPLVKMGRYEWLVSTDPNASIGTGRPAAANQGVIGYSNVSVPEADYAYYQIAEIEGEIRPFDGNYRTAISIINEFAETLRKQENVYNVSITSLPLDVSQDSNMQGNTKSSQREARFSLRVVLGVRT